MTIKLDDLYFGVKELDFNIGKLVTRNLFDIVGIKWSVSNHIVNKQVFNSLEDAAFDSFHGVWSKTEYQFMVCPWGGLKDDDKVCEVGQKVDIYTMYVLPNMEYLLDLVNQVDVEDAKAYLREWKKLHK